MTGNPRAAPCRQAHRSGGRGPECSVLDLFGERIQPTLPSTRCFLRQVIALQILSFFNVKLEEGDFTAPATGLALRSTA